MDKDKINALMLEFMGYELAEGMKHTYVINDVLVHACYYIPTTDMNQAMEGVRKCANSSFSAKLDLYKCLFPDEYKLTFKQKQYIDWFCELTPLAICEAILTVMGLLKP